MQIYLDNAATTQIDEKVLSILNKSLKEDFGNTSSIHKKGKEAKEKLEQARKEIAKTLNAEPEEIIFTSGATEANNLAIKGILKASKKKDIIISTIEHVSIKNLCEELQKEGYTIHKIPVDKDGFVQINELKKKLNEKIAIISFIHANNETGVIQDIQKIAELCAQKNIPFHTDAVQSYKKIPLDLKKIKLTVISISAHKIHGPKGIGVLYIRKGTKIKALFNGGKQEHGLRPGTENLPYIRAFAAAAQLPYPSKQIDKKKTYLIKKLKEILNIKINTPEKSICNVVNLSIKGVNGETLVRHLSEQGIYISTGSACSSGTIEASHVLKAMGLTEEQARSSIRVSLSKNTTKKEIDETIKHLKSIVPILRNI
ncbi:MAG: cysteine desulfurase family protein [bacterium]|nr:cysteine desulfurase family protein [bacterium]